MRQFPNNLNFLRRKITEHPYRLFILHEKKLDEVGFVNLKTHLKDLLAFRGALGEWGAEDNFQQLQLYLDWDAAQIALFRKDLSREITELTIHYLVKSGVHLELGINWLGLKYCHCLPHGEHKINLRAKQLDRGLQGLQLFLNLEDLNAEGFSRNYDHSVHLNASNLLNFDPKGSTIGHEIRHVLSNLDPARNLGSLYSGGDVNIPFQGLNSYQRFMAFEETEQFLFSLSRMLTKLEKIYSKNNFNPEAANMLEASIYRYVIHSRNFSWTNSWLVRHLEPFLKDGNIRYGETRLMGNQRYPYAVIEFEDRRGEYLYKMPLASMPLTKSNMPIEIDKKYQLMRLNAKMQLYQTQILFEALTPLDRANTQKEKRAVIGAMRSLIRPVFWDFSKKLPTKKELRERYYQTVWNRIQQ